MKIARLLAGYLYFGREKETETGNSMVGLMHRINRICLFLYLLCLLVIITRAVGRAVTQ